MSGIVGGINLRSSGLVNNSSAADGSVITGTGVGLPAGFEAAAGGEATYVQFPATQVASADANRLDDYEEGDFSVWFTAAGSGSLATNSSFNELAYTKVGRVCHINGQIVWGSVSSPVGDLRLNGLPFAAISLDEYTENSGFSVDIRNLVSAIDGYITGHVVAGGTIIYIREAGTTGEGDDLANHIDAGSTFFIAGSYLTV